MVTQVEKYENVRNLILDGDLIAVRGRRGIFGIITRFVTNSDYTHNGIAIWLDNGLWLAEINIGGNHLVPMSQLRDDFDVLNCPADRNLVRTAILEKLRNHKAYGVSDLFRIAARRFFNWNLGNGNGEVCSEFSMQVYSAAGANLTVPKLPTPDEIVLAVGNLKFKVDV